MAECLGGIENKKDEWRKRLAERVVGVENQEKEVETNMDKTVSEVKLISARGADSGLTKTR